MPQRDDPEHTPGSHAEHNRGSGIPLVVKLLCKDEQIGRGNDRAGQDAEQSDSSHAEPNDRPISAHFGTSQGAPVIVRPVIHTPF
jgi:hypothetical protein